MKNHFLTSIKDAKDLNSEKRKGIGPGPGFGPERNGKVSSPERTDGGCGKECTLSPALNDRYL